MIATTEKFERPFLTNWILVTSGAFILSLPVVIIVPQLFPPIPWLGGTPIIGAVVGYAQWIMLRKRIALSGWWVLACAIGLGLPPLVDLIASGVGLLPHFPGGTGGKILGWTSFGIVGGLLSPDISCVSSREAKKCCGCKENGSLGAQRIVDT